LRAPEAGNWDFFIHDRIQEVAADSARAEDLLLTQWRSRQAANARKIMLESLQFPKTSEFW